MRYVARVRHPIYPVREMTKFRPNLLQGTEDKVANEYPAPAPKEFEVHLPKEDSILDDAYIVYQSIHNGPERILERQTRIVIYLGLLDEGV